MWIKIIPCIQALCSAHDVATSWNRILLADGDVKKTKWGLELGTKEMTSSKQVRRENEQVLLNLYLNAYNTNMC